jgi:hypothetical protein
MMSFPSAASGLPTGAISAGGPSANAPSFAGGARAVTFSRVVTVADSSFATITVTLPRSTYPTYIIAAISAGAGVIQVQGNGPETYATAVTVNVPASLSLAGFPPSNTVGVQVEQFAASTLTGAVFYV